MPRYKLVIEYDGTRFSGWQRQASDPSVQQSVEEAVDAFCGHPVRLHCAGRTDAGVHATHQVAHVELEREWRTDVVRDASNARLKRLPVAVLSAEAVPDSFDARISAKRRPAAAAGIGSQPRLACPGEARPGGDGPRRQGAAGPA